MLCSFLVFVFLIGRVGVFEGWAFKNYIVITGDKISYLPQGFLGLYFIFEDCIFVLLFQLKKILYVVVCDS